MTVEKDLGVAFGLVVRSMGFAKSFGAGLTSLRQGEVPEGRRRIVGWAPRISRVRVVAYGTAVVVRPAG